MRAKCGSKGVTLSSGHRRHRNLATANGRSLPGIARQQAVKNIIATYNKALMNPAVMDLGSLWYVKNNKLVSEMSEQYCIAQETIAGIIASFSGKTPWEVTLKHAQKFLEYRGKLPGKIGHRGAIEQNIAKAEKFYAGQTADQVCGSRMHGKKTLDEVKEWNFVRNILDPVHDQSVTVDRHAFSVALGHAASKFERSQLYRIGVYRNVADAYREAAQRLRIDPPSKLQAITWEYWRTTNTIRSRGKSSALACTTETGS